MTKEQKNNKQTIKSKIIWNVLLFFVMAIIILGSVLWDYYAIWSYIDKPAFLDKEILQSPAEKITQTPSAALTSSPIPTITPNNTSALSNTKKPTATPVPTPIPHPGDRDSKFTQGEIKIGDLSYQSENLSIEIKKYYEDKITYFVAEVYVRDMDNFFAAFADGIYDSKVKKITQTTSEMAQDNNAIFAVSGDYYNARDGGIVIRNSEIYRHETEPYRDVLAIYKDGSMEGFYYKDANADDLLGNDVVHTYVFGPLLISDYKEAMEFTPRHRTTKHPRSAIGMIEPYHYYFILADGRKQGYSDGMSLYELAQKFMELGCEVAYALDGGGSATMVFMNELVNMPLGTSIERGIGDSICFIK